MVISPCTPDDVDNVAPLVLDYLSHISVDTNIDRVRFFIDDVIFQSKGIILLARCDDLDISGFLTAFPLPSTGMLGDTLFVNDVYVAPAQRRRGIASALYQFCFSYARSNGFRSVRWLVEADDNDALSFHRELDAEEISWIRFTKRLAHGPLS